MRVRCVAMMYLVVIVLSVDVMYMQCNARSSSEWLQNMLQHLRRNCAYHLPADPRFSWKISDQQESRDGINAVMSTSSSIGNVIKIEIKVLWLHHIIWKQIQTTLSSLDQWRHVVWRKYQPPLGTRLHRGGSKHCRNVLCPAFRSRWIINDDIRSIRIVFQIWGECTEYWCRWWRDGKDKV